MYLFIFIIIYTLHIAPVFFEAQLGYALGGKFASKLAMIFRENNINRSVMKDKSTSN